MKKITVWTWDERNYLTMDDNCFTMQMGKEITTIALSQVISMEIRDPKGKMRPGMIELRTAGTSDWADRAINTWILGVGPNSIGFPHAYAYLNEAHEMKKQFIEFQNQKLSPQPTPQITSGADEILKFKELLDAGIISQEEFDAKKKQLLGI